LSWRPDGKDFEKEVNEMEPWELHRSALLKAAFREISSSLVTMTPMSYAELWSREKANLRRGFRGRQKELSPNFDVEACGEAARALTKRIQKLARAEKRAEYDKAPRLDTPSMTRREASEFPGVASTIGRKAA
jgi:hypothetical protein